jgi:vitamin B12 transporter
VTVGSAFERQQAEPANGDGPLPSRHRVTVGGYAQLAGAGGRVDHAIGVRLDDNSLFGRFVTARAAAGWRIARGMRLRASVGNAYKEPGLDEQFDTPFTTGNPDLDPERVTTWEAGVEQAIAADRLALRATYFDQRFQDLIQYGFQQGPGGSDFRNVPDASARGVELEARTTALPAGLSIAASYTALRTRARSEETAPGTYEDGARLLRRPTHSGSATLAWARPGRAHLAAVVNAAATRDDLRFGGAPDFLTTRVALPGYATLDLSGDVTVVHAGRGADVVLTGRLENALDKRYEPVVNYRNLGRRALVGVRIGR